MAPMNTRGRSKRNVKDTPAQSTTLALRKKPPGPRSKATSRAMETEGAEQEAEAEVPKRKRGRPPKVVHAAEDTEDSEQEDKVEVPRRKSGRPRKLRHTTEDMVVDSAEAEVKVPKRKSGTLRKMTHVEEDAVADSEGTETETPKRKRRKLRKAEHAVDDKAVDSDEAHIEAPKRKRGKPPKESQSTGTADVSSGAKQSVAANVTMRRNRGRPAKAEKDPNPTDDATGGGNALGGDETMQGNDTGRVDEEEGMALELITRTLQQTAIAGHAIDMKNLAPTRTHGRLRGNQSDIELQTMVNVPISGDVPNFNNRLNTEQNSERSLRNEAAEIGLMRTTPHPKKDTAHNPEHQPDQPKSSWAAVLVLPLELADQARGSISEMTRGVTEKDLVDLGAVDAKGLEILQTAIDEINAQNAGAV